MVAVDSEQDPDDEDDDCWTNDEECAEDEEEEEQAEQEAADPELPICKCCTRKARPYIGRIGLRPTHVWPPRACQIVHISCHNSCLLWHAEAAGGA